MKVEVRCFSLEREVKISDSISLEEALRFIDAEEHHGKEKEYRIYDLESISGTPILRVRGGKIPSFRDLVRVMDSLYVEWELSRK